MMNIFQTSPGGKLSTLLADDQWFASAVLLDSGAPCRILREESASLLKPGSSLMRNAYARPILNARHEVVAPPGSGFVRANG